MDANYGITRTKAEQKMANALIKQGIRFVQNYRLEGYEVDFWIKEAGLVVEIDGFTHLSNKKSASDQTKDRTLLARGYAIVRFENRQVNNNLDKCVNEIKTIIQQTKAYFQKNDTVNSVWKDSLKPIAQKLRSSEKEEKCQTDIEAYFLSLDREID